MFETYEQECARRAAGLLAEAEGHERAQVATHDGAEAMLRKTLAQRARGQAAYWQGRAELQAMLRTGRHV